MLEHDGNTIRTVAWAEVFPWLNIVRSFRVAIAARTLVLGALGFLLTAIGWWFVAALFGTDTPATKWLEPFAGCPWVAVTNAVPNGPSLPMPMTSTYWAWPPHGSQEQVALFPWYALTTPAFQGLTQTDQAMRAVASVLLCGLWAAAVWAFFGAAICRIAAVHLAADEQVGWGAAVRYAARKWPAYFAAPLFPVGGVVLATIPVLILGLIMRANVGLFLGGLLWPLVLVAGLLMTVLLLGTLFGWPLMWATISTEGSDSFDALSRTYAYLFQRPLHYLFYVIVAGFIGWVGWLLVENFAGAVIWMGYWAAGWGCGAPTIESIRGGGEPLLGLGNVGALLIHFWADCVKLLAVGYLFSYFWSASAAIYLLLRRNVDATEMDEVFLDADKSEETFGLPTIATDQAGAPVVADDADPSQEAE
jgi:hypothetical protein